MHKYNLQMLVQNKQMYYLPQKGKHSLLSDQALETMWV